MPDLTIPDFLRAIGKGPEQMPEWWRLCWHAPNGGIPISQLPESVECDTWEPVLCPFYTIITGDWTPDKDALLLGVGLEWLRGLGDNKLRIEDYMHYHFGEFLWESEIVWATNTPGLTLARAIWAAMKGGGK